MDPQKTIVDMILEYLKGKEKFSPAGKGYFGDKSIIYRKTS